MIGITGASSGIGQAVIGAARQLGVETVSLGRRTGASDRHYDLTEPLGDRTLEGLDALVHLAWSWSTTAGIDREAGCRLASACSEREVRPILLSTLSSFAAETSRYGADKVAVEQDFIAAGGAALRAGLIWGSQAAGMMATLAKLAAVPLVAARLAPDPLMRHSQEAVLAELLIREAVTPTGSAITVAASREPVELSKLMARLRGPRFGVPVPVPVPLLGVVASLAERVGVPLPFRSDSLAALSPRAEQAIASTELPWADGFAGSDAMLDWAAVAAGRG